MAIGKSWVANEIAHSLAEGRDLFDLFQVPAPCRVLLVDREVGPVSYRQRLDAYLKRKKDVCYLHNISFISKSDQESVNYLDLVGGYSYLETAIRSAKPDVLILDPISFFLAGEEKSGQVVRSVYTALYDLIRQTGSEMSVVFFHHFREVGREGDPLDMRNFRGSTKWGDDADTRTTMMQEAAHSPAERWRLKTRWVFRHAQSPPEFSLIIRPDWRVIVEGSMKQGGIFGGLGSKPSGP